MTARKWVAIALMAIGILTASVGIVGFVLAGGGGPAVVATPTPSPSPSPTTSQLIRDFYAQLGQAFQTNNQAFLYDHLHPEVSKLYGEDQCRRHISAIIGNRGFEVLQIHDPAPWNYGEKEGREIIIPGSIQVDVNQRLNEETIQSATHVVVDGAVVQWFTDCGTPV